MSCPQGTSLVVSTVNFAVYIDAHPGAFVFGFFEYQRLLDSRTRARFDLKFFRVFLIKNRYRKIPKINPGAYIFQRPFLRGLFLEGLIFRGAYLWREICISKSIGLAL